MTPGPSGDLMDLILVEAAPGRFRSVMARCWQRGPISPVVSVTLDTLVKEGWLEPDEVSQVRGLVETTVAGCPQDQWVLYLALCLDRAGIPLAERGIFRDDPSLRAAMDVAAARCP